MKNCGNLIQGSRETRKMLVKYLDFKLNDQKYCDLRKTIKTAVNPTLSGGGQLFTLSQCLCRKLCTLLFFNKYYSLATMSICVFMDSIFQIHRQKLRFPSH